MLPMGQSVGHVVQALEAGEQEFHRRRSQCSGAKADEARLPKALDAENKRLKKLSAGAERDKTLVKEAVEGND